MHNNIFTPEGWSIKFNEKDLEKQLHGDFGHELDFSETQDFALDVPESIRKTAKAGYIFINRVTGNSLQKGADGRWRKIKDAAKKLLGIKKKASPEPEEEDQEVLERQQRVKKPGEKEEIQKDMKPEISPEDEKKLKITKDMALDDVSHGYFMGLSGTSNNPSWAIASALSSAKKAAEKIAMKTGQTPSKVLDQIIKEGKAQGCERANKDIQSKVAPIYKEMEDLKYLYEQGAISKQDALDKSNELLDKVVAESDKLKKLAQEWSDADKSKPHWTELYKQLKDQAKEEGKKLHEKNKGDIQIPEQKTEEKPPWEDETVQPPEEESKDVSSLVSGDTFKNALDAIQGSVKEISLKNPIKKQIESLGETFDYLTKGDDIQKAADFLKNVSTQYKQDTRNKLEALGQKIENMKSLGDSGYQAAKEAYDKLINGLNDLGLKDFTPEAKKEGVNKHEPDKSISKEQQNYGKMLDPDYRYKPFVKLEDLTEVFKNKFKGWVESSEKYAGNSKFPEFEDVSPDALAAIRMYTGSAFTSINNLARGKVEDVEGNTTYEKYDFLLGKVDEGLKQMRMQPPETLYRGVSSEKLLKAFLARGEGDTIYDHGYFSASSDKETAEAFGTKVFLQIENAQGYYVDKVSQCAGEEERLFPRGTAFKIKRMENVNGQLRVTLEHILSDSEKEKYERQKEGKKEPKQESSPEIGKAKIPESIDLLDYAKGKPLGGSTGARLLEINGTKFVVKKGANEEQNKQEQSANSLYNAIGAKTSNSGLSDMGGTPVVVSEFIPGKDLGDQPLNTSEDIKKFGEQIIKGHAMDALINNRDVFGLNYDNIRIGDNGEVYRIDNGGSFDTKATGGKKPFDGVPLEFFSMLERGGGKEFYHGIPVEAAYDSIKSLFDNYDEIKKLANETVPENLRGVFFKRLSNLREIKDFWDYAKANEIDSNEAHKAIKEYFTELHKKDPNATASYPKFKKSIAHLIK